MLETSTSTSNSTVIPDSLTELLLTYESLTGLSAESSEESSDTEPTVSSAVGREYDWDNTSFIKFCNRSPLVYGTRRFLDRPKRSSAVRMKLIMERGDNEIDPPCAMDHWRIKNLLDVENDPKDKKTWKMTPSHLEMLMRDRDLIVAMSFSPMTSFVAIDIDKGSAYHPFNGGNDQSLVRTMAAIGLEHYVRIVSSSSGGLHYYFPFPYECKSFVVAQTVTTHLERCGINVAPGQCEVFPNVKSYRSIYKILRLPLQTGSQLVDHEFSMGKDLISAEWETFMRAMSEAASFQDFEKFTKALERKGFPPVTVIKHRARTKEEKKEYYRSRQLKFKQAQSGGTAEDQPGKLRQAMERLGSGWSGPGQSNGLLMDLGFVGRCAHDHRGGSLARYIQDMAVKLDGYEQFASADTKKRVANGSWPKAIAHYYRNLECYGNMRRSKEPDPEHNDRLSLEAKNRIIEAMRSINRKVFSSLSVAIQCVAEAAKSSVRTVKDHQYLLTEKFFIRGGKYKTKVKALLPLNYPRIQEPGAAPQYNFQSFLVLPPCSMAGSYFGNWLSPVTDLFSALGLFAPDSQPSNDQTSCTPSPIFGEPVFSWMWGFVTQGVSLTIDSG